MESILEPLVRSPKFPDYVDELNEFRRREAEARRRFRDALDEDKREEFINGEVVSLMTARHSHNMTVANLARLIGTFVRVRNLGLVLQEQALTEFPRNDYAPDLCYWDAAKSARIDANTSVYPPPDFIVEVISSSTEARDRDVKFEDYAAHGVREYWIVDPERRVIEQFTQAQGRYELRGKFDRGEIHSVVIDGFQMPAEAAFDDQANLAALRALLA